MNKMSEYQAKHHEQIEKALEEAGYKYHFTFKPARNSGTRIERVCAYITKEAPSPQPQMVFVHLFKEGGLDVYVTLDNSITMAGTLEAIRKLKVQP